MGIIILKPQTKEKSYNVSAEIFRDMYQRVTGISLPVVEADDGESDVVAIGSDAVNNFTMEHFLSGETGCFGIRYGSDDYRILSVRSGNRNFLFFVGGRGRSTIYAVYHYFEQIASCRYFWDGDIIPHRDSLSIESIDILEQSRFEYRGMRYFAHRGLWRFQAEHWSLDDWKREIDWMAKKRLNFFMLRIGMDDLWQRVFPDVVPYPDEDMQKSDDVADDFNDRSIFWSLEYRGELRKQLLQYAFDRDLMHPEDCGTMSHWYSPAPKEFLDKIKPDFLTQASNVYNNAPTLAWDIRIQRNMDLYMKLTDGYVREYNPNANLFHTIGLGERLISEDRDKNMRMKQFTYRKICQSIREKYPDSKLLIAGWDFYFTWKSEEVRKMIEEFDAEHNIILDYTSDSDDPDGSFLNWGYYKHFPWIFGIFHAYEAQSAIHGPYERIAERLKAAEADDFCKGMILWPELSHSDTLMLEYFTRNAWKPSGLSIEEITKEFCSDRYGNTEYSEEMKEIWLEALPLIKKCDWGGNTKRKEGEKDWEKYSRYLKAHQDIWTDIDAVFYGAKDKMIVANYNYILSQNQDVARQADRIISMLEALPEEAMQNEFIRRDAADLSRTVLGREMSLIMLQISVLKYNKQESEIVKHESRFWYLFDKMEQALASHEDFSMVKTVEKLKKTAYVNRNFESTLKHNISNSYCRQQVYDLMEPIYRPDLEYLFERFESSNELPSGEEVKRVFDETRERFFKQ